MLVYFSLTLFVSATLLFLVQPMIGKMILPQLGGTPAVWNTCMVFFQGVLLIGYGYTHLLTTTQPPRRQVLIQVVMLFFPFLALPFALGNWEPPTDSNPIFSLVGKLTLMVGFPFFAVSTTAPLLQKWFVHTGHTAAKDPYFLYGASNFGSMVGLALYPTVIEPWFKVAPSEGENTINTQVHLWTFGFAIFVGLVVGCAVVVWRSLGNTPATSPSLPNPPPRPQSEPIIASAPVVETSFTPRKRVARIETTVAEKGGKIIALPPLGDGITWWRRLRWVGLAAAASSLMLGVTTYMTTDIAAVAFFWILPLALYLLTFILVFARWPVIWTGTPHTIVLLLQPCFLLFLVLKMIAHLAPDRYDLIISFFLHLAAFFTTALMCHGELAKDRPTAKHLTEFYFWMSLGGVLGGLFNALFAPVVFQLGIWEYPIAMAFACVLRSNMVEEIQPMIPGDSTADRRTPLGYALDFAVPIILGVAGYGMAYACDHYTGSFVLIRRSYLLAILVVIVLAVSLRPVRFGLSVAALFIALGIYDRTNDPLLYEGRGFFGLLRVRETRGGWQLMPRVDETNEEKRHQWKVYRELIHGGINHGRQIVRFKYDNDIETDALNLQKRREPITYFHERNGIAEIYRKFSWPDWRLPASLVGLMSGEFATLGMLADTQSEPAFAVVGLGTGILASFAKPYQTVDIYEIDPLVKNMSMVPGYVPSWDVDARKKMPDNLRDPIFYFVQDAQDRGSNISVILGDGRLKIKDAPKNYYHIITLDAFSSDAIPVHLLTADAIDLYLDKLAEGGVLIFNTTNRYVRIEGVLAAIAKERDLDCLACADYGYREESYPYDKEHPDRYGADWVVLQRKIKKDYRNGGPPIDTRLEKNRRRLSWDGKPLLDSRGDELIEERWKVVDPLPGPIWTDSYSNLLRIMNWR